MKPVLTTVNLLSNPLSVLKNNLTFSYLQGKEELSGCRFVFAKSETDLENKEYLFDSGVMNITETTGIVVEGLGETLSEDTMVVCAVQTVNEKGEASEFSKPFTFFTAKEDWNPKSVWVEDQNGESPDFCLLRKEFSLAKVPYKALLQLTARSPEKARQYIYHAGCNGEDIGLGPTRYHNRGENTVLYFDTLDITASLKEGANCVYAKCYTPEDHRFAARLVTFDELGNKTVLFEDATEFEGLDGTALYRPQGSIGTNYFPASPDNINGEVWPYGWNEPLYQGDFVPVSAKENMGDDMVLRPYPAPAVGFYKKSAALVEITEEGNAIVDLGKEIIGGIELNVECDAPCDITLTYGEELNEDGSVRYKMRTTNVYEEYWRLKAGENLLSSLGMKTFRYVEIQGLSRDITTENISGVAYRTGFDEKQSYFTSSSELLNEIYDLCKYTIEATNQNLYVDSQSRERCAYEGDVVINMLTAAGVQDCNALARFSVEYLLTHRTWPAEYGLFRIVMSRLDYDTTGDIAMVKRNYKLLKTCLYQNLFNEEIGLYGSALMSGHGWDAVLVDWPMTERDDYDYTNSFYNTVFNCINLKALNDLGYLAQALGEKADAARYGQMADALRKTMVAKLYNSEKGAFVDGLTEEGSPVEHTSQHATAYALFAGVFADDEMKDKMASFLKEQGAIRMSVYGAFFLLEGLYRAGAGEYANSLLLSDDVSEGARTWAYMLDKLNATITTEAWNPVNKSNMTWSHPWGSAAGAEIVRGLFGIRPLVAGFRSFVVDLQPAGLRYAAIQVPTVKGAITVSFDATTKDESLLVNLTVPMGTDAVVMLPAKENESIWDGEQELESTKTRAKDKRVVVLKSGTYTLQVK